MTKAEPILLYPQADGTCRAYDGVTFFYEGESVKSVSRHLTLNDVSHRVVYC